MRNERTVDGLNSNATRCLTVELLTGETIAIPYEVKTTCNTIWRGVEGELVARGVVHPQIFGLAIPSGSDWVFVDPDAKLSKYYPNVCKEGKLTGQVHLGTSVCDGKKPAFYCRVHFYLDLLPQNFDIVSLQHYYLQLRHNLIAAPRFPPASIVQPLAYAFQYEIGDWRPGQELPRWASSQSKVVSLGPAIFRAHQNLLSLGKDAARLAFVRALMPQYNMHLFAMTLKTKEDKSAPAWVGVTPKGIEVYQNSVGCNEIPAQPRLTFLWANITKLYFERKKYGIRGQAFPWGNSTQKLTFTAATESVPQHLLHLCRSTHQFHLSNHKILAGPESINGNGSGGGSYNGNMQGSVGSTGESSCNSTLLSSSSKNDDKMLDLSLWADGLLLTGESSDHQRVSVISNASSNTTSGIVSDRVYSLDGSEAEDLEMRDCCTEKAHNHNHNSTSLESLSQRQPPPPTSCHQNLSRARKSHNHAGSSSNATNTTSNVHKGVTNKCVGVSSSVAEIEDDSEAKYWYCDSDCEDCEDSGPCRSMLVRTIGKQQRSKCAGHCECNSCLNDEEDEDGEDEQGNEGVVCGGRHFHHNTPSMASETTLKAVDFVDGVSEEGVSVVGAKMNKNLVQMEYSAEEMGDGDIEEYKLEDEHVYGEISEDPEPLLSKPGNSVGSNKNRMTKTEDEQQYSIIEDGGDDADLKTVEVHQPKLGYNCNNKSVHHEHQNKPMLRLSKGKDKCCNPSRKHGPKRGHNTAHTNECRNCLSSSCSAITSSDGKTAEDGTGSGLAPKVASLKCLRKPSGKPSCTSNVRRHISSRHRGEINFTERPPVNYVEFGEKLQQGRYPSTRTVSDNFDTDSDYVQLPPLAWYPPPRPPPKKLNSMKLWKCVSKPENCGKPKVASPPSLSPPVNMSTLPRRKSDHANNKVGLRSSLVAGSKPPSRSTNAINLVGLIKPEPPPKPRKSFDLTSTGKELEDEDDNCHQNDGNVINARFIATKPQILIQTAYATTAPIAIPSQAQLLIRSQVLLGNNTISHPTLLQHSQSVDNIYDTVACEEQFVPSIMPLCPAKTSTPLIIRPNNYIDVHASSVKSKLSLASNISCKPNGGVISAIANHYTTNPATATGLGKTNVGNRCGSVPNNLNNFLIGLQNLKPLSRTPIVHPAGATSCLTLNNNNADANAYHSSGSVNHHHLSSASTLGQLQQRHTPVTTTSTNTTNPRFTTVYTNQLTRSQIQQFKAQLYSDIDYVVFPPKDPRVSQQEYLDSKCINSNPMLNNNSSNSCQLNGDIPPPYLPPPPPYPCTQAVPGQPSNVPPPLPKKNPKFISSRPLPNPNYSSTNVTAALSNHSVTSPSPYHHTSFQSLYHQGSTNSHCSSSQYGYYTATAASGGLNSDNLQRFLSTQSFSNGSNGSSGPIYYPSSTQSAPPLPPYKSSHVLENGMRKTVQQKSLSSRNSFGLTASDERLRMNMKLCRSEESLYSQPTNEEEDQLQAIYNLPPPPPYQPTFSPQSTFRAKQEAFSAAELDLAHLRARCHALELPLLRALCSEGELLNKNTSTKAIMQAAKNRLIRPTTHVHPKLSLAPENPLPIPPKPKILLPARHQQAVNNTKTIN